MMHTAFPARRNVTNGWINYTVTVQYTEQVPVPYRTVSTLMYGIVGTSLCSIYTRQAENSLLSM